MLTDQLRTIVVSSLGWADHASLWTFRAAEDRETRLPLPSEAKYISLHLGNSDYFSVLHHFETDRVEVSVHHFAEPEAALARAVLQRDSTAFHGDPGLWAHVPANYIAYCSGPHWSDFALVRLRASDRVVELQQFDWYTDTYDKVWQGVIGVAEIPNQETLLVSVQRDSQPVLYDPIARRKIGTIELADRRGNPTLFFRSHANEVWADDYDTIVKLEVGTWRRVGSRLLQGADAGTRQFIGRFWFDPEETMCVVARPFSGDVIALAPGSLRTRFRSATGGQPLEAVVLPDRSVVARDWKTGALLRGRLRRAWAV